MIEKERSSIIPAVISLWCTQFKAPCDSCWCVLTCCNEEHGWHTAISKAEQKCSHRCHNSNSSSNSLVYLSSYQTHNVNVTPPYYYNTESLWKIIISVSFIRGHCCHTTECQPLVCVSPSVSMASCTQSSTQSKQMSLCCLVQGNASFIGQIAWPQYLVG